MKKGKNGKKKVPKVLLATQQATKSGFAASWGKGIGGPYPWRKK